jgi:hypothetical protein
MDVDVDHLDLVTTFVGRDQVTAGDLVDERWTNRLWEAEVWAQVVRRHCGRGRVREAHPFLWAADNPADEPPAPPQPLGLGASTWQNDSGLFELSFRDERYLPFEYRGAVGRFRIELPQEDNRFALDALADVVLRVDFTARRGGEALREAARAAARRQLPGAGVRLFDARHDFPDDWYALTGREATGAWPLQLTSDQFPFLPGRCEVEVTRLGLYVEVEDPGCRGSLPVTLVTRHLRDHGRGDDCDCPGRTIECLATSKLSRLFHGVADVELRVPRSGHRRPIAVLRFPERVLIAAYPVCGYRICR